MFSLVNNTNDIATLISKRTSERRLTTVDFVACELEINIKVARAGVLALLRAGSLSTTFVGNQVAYAAR